MSEYLHAKHAKNEDYEKLVELMDTAFSILFRIFFQSFTIKTETIFLSSFALM